MTVFQEVTLTGTFMLEKSLMGFTMATLITLRSHKNASLAWDTISLNISCLRSWDSRHYGEYIIFPQRDRERKIWLLTRCDLTFVNNFRHSIPSCNQWRNSGFETVAQGKMQLQGAFKKQKPDKAHNGYLQSIYVRALPPRRFYVKRYFLLLLFIGGMAALAWLVFSVQ